ncbi:MAG: carboxylating nicotinate-nucleotide diphosphorylase [candidate division WOR-3 bacterium]
MFKNLASKPEIRKLIRKALEEDIGRGDWTSEYLLKGEERCRAVIRAKEGGVLAGIEVCQLVFKSLDKGIVFEPKKRDGEEFKKGEVLAVIEGKAKAILSAERVALNFLQRMCGIATLTRKFVEKTRGTKAKIMDTRKTTPLLRILEKYAVKVGGGKNHRFGLFDMILIKDNHLKLVKGIEEALARVERRNKKGLPVEIEVKNLKEFLIAQKVGAELIMLDNMSLKEIREAVKRKRPGVKLEVSGGVNLKNVRAIAKTGVDYISVGSLTHSVKAIDISLDIL